MKIKFKRLHPNAVIPKYAHGSENDAGMDLYAVEKKVLEPGVPAIVKLGFSMELPPGYEAQIRSRSGMAFKFGVCVANSPGTVDPSYRGEVGVILIWTGLGKSQDARIEINPGERVAQMVIAKYEAAEFVKEDLSDSERGSGGFGSTGV